MTPTRFSWRASLIEGTGLTIDLIDSDRPNVLFGDLPGLRSISQVHEPVQLGIWVGPEATLAWWRGRFVGRDATSTPPRAIEVCERTAHHQGVTVRAQRATGLVLDYAGPGHIDDRPVAEVHTAIAGVSPAGPGFVVSWRVPVSRREELRRDEQHYLSSIRCRT